MIKREQIRYALAVIVTAFIFCIYNSMGKFIYLPNIVLFSAIVLAAIIVRNMLMLVREIWEKTNKKQFSIISYMYKLQAKIYGLSTGRFFLLVWLIVLICFIPAYIALFPGTFGYDGPVQIAQYFGKLELTTHHPLLHTYFMGMFFSLGKVLFDSYTVGFAAYTAVQGLIITGAIAYSCVIAKRLGINILALGVGVAYIAFNPFVQMIAFSSTKDALFGAFLLFFVAELLNPSETRRHYVLVSVFGVLMCLFRNQGVYIVIVLLMLVPLFKLCNRRSVFSLACVVVAVMLFSVFTRYVLEIPSGDAREMLSVPMQQVTYAARVHTYELTDE